MNQKAAEKSPQCYHGPGATQFTRTPGASFAAVLVNAIIAALLAQYAALPGVPMFPKVLAAET